MMRPMRAVHADGELVTGLVDLARSVAGDTGRGGQPVVLSARADEVVVRVGDVVVKAHSARTDAAALTLRLRAATSPPLRGVLLAPLPIPPTAGARAGLVTHVSGRLATAWPAGEPVDRADPDAAPWAQGARLLARLHRTPVDMAFGTDAAPPVGAPARVGRALARLRAAADTPARTEVMRAAARLPPWARGQAAPAPDREGALVHGDWHLGQLVHRPAPGGAADWRLIDVEDLGVGDPAWDLARPAAWYGAGLLPPAAWGAFLEAYRAAGGPAVPPDGGPWPVLDLPARALAVQLAATGVVEASHERRPLDEVEAALVDACRRIVRVQDAGAVW